MKVLNFNESRIEYWLIRTIAKKTAIENFFVLELIPGKAYDLGVADAEDFRRDTILKSAERVTKEFHDYYQGFTRTMQDKYKE